MNMAISSTRSLPSLEKLIAYLGESYSSQVFLSLASPNAENYVKCFLNQF